MYSSFWIASAKLSKNFGCCYYQTGDFDLIIRISCHSSDELEEIHRQVMSLPGVDATRTHVVLKNVKNIYSAIRRPDK